MTCAEKKTINIFFHVLIPSLQFDPNVFYFEIFHFTWHKVKVEVEIRSSLTILHPVNLVQNPFIHCNLLIRHKNSFIGFKSQIYCNTINSHRSYKNTDDMRIYVIVFFFWVGGFFFNIKLLAV